MKKTYFLYGAALLAISLLMVFINESRGNHFVRSVKDTHALFTDADPAISAEDADAAGPDLLQVEVLHGEAGQESDDYIAIPFEAITDPAFVRRLRKHGGPIAIISKDLSLAAPAWVILTRMGIDNIRIMDADDDETPKYTSEPLPGMGRD